MQWKSWLVVGAALTLVVFGACGKDKPTGPQTGMIAVSSDPSGARIYIDGEYTRKVTPYTLKDIEEGLHALKLTLEHHADWHDTVDVVANDVVIVHAELVSLVGSIAVSSDPSGARIYLDGSNTHKVTPDTLFNVGVGSRVIKLTLFRHLDWVDTVRVGSDSLTVVEATIIPESGKIVVTSSPGGAEIWLDGENTNQVTPDTLENVPLGSHTVKLVLESYEEYTRTVYLSRQGEIESVHAMLTLKCPGGIIGDLNLLPEIQIVGLELGIRTIRGIANNIDASVVRVVLWAKTDIWYVQPLIVSPYTTICADGSWQNWTHPWSRMVALLVDTTYIPGSIRLEHPSSDPGVIAWDEYPEPSADRIINFGGYKWKVKTAEAYRAGPGPNYFSGSESDVWLDSDGLHLTTVHRGGKWYCTEVFADHSFGYGIYTFQLGSRVDSLDYRAVFAGFVYESASREIDIEFSRALADPDNAQYVVQPYNNPGNIIRFMMPAAEFSTHRFEWREDRIEFTSWTGLSENPNPGDIIYSWTYTGFDIPPPGGERMRFNLWLFWGEPPLGGRGDEVVIKSFRYQP